MGSEAVVALTQLPEVDVVVNALVGAAGLEASYTTLKAGKVLALANKESLVVGGEVVMRLAAEKRAPILPVDSEHSAIFQCLAGESSRPRRLIVTCSGGSFRDLPAEALADVTVEQALHHPQWHMGAKITIDSSTLVNKGFEVIEARWLFDMPADRIDVILHPQSIVHSMVEFDDGAIKAQLGTPTCGCPSAMRSSTPAGPAARRSISTSSTIRSSPSRRSTGASIRRSTSPTNACGGEVPLAGDCPRHRVCAQARRIHPPPDARRLRRGR